MGAGARRSRGRRAGRVGAVLAALVAVAGLVVVLVAHRSDVRANPNSAVIVAVPPLTGPVSADATVAPLRTAGRGTESPAPVDGGGLNTDPMTPENDPATAASWPTPPVDPTAPVDAALAAATADGVTLGVVVVDRSSGAVLLARDADTPYPSLSLLKVMIAADVLTSGWPVGADPTTVTGAADAPDPEGAAVTPVTDAGPGGFAGIDGGPDGFDGGPDGLGTGVDQSAGATGADQDSTDQESTDQAGESLPALTDPAQIDAVLTRMIATSDDVIASDLYDATGGDAMVDRVAQRYGMTGTTPTPDGEYWGNVQVTASDVAALLAGVLADPQTASVIGPAMRATTAIAADGVDQRFGLRMVPGAGSKQGWGCCLSGIAGIHSMGFTDDRIVVVLSGTEPDDDTLGEQDGLALQADAGAQVGFAAVDDVVRAALGGPAG